MSRSAKIHWRNETAVIVFDAPVLQSLSDSLEESGFTPKSFDNVDDAWMFMRHGGRRVKVIVAKAMLPGVLNGADFATRVANTHPQQPMGAGRPLSGANRWQCETDRQALVP